MNYVKTHGAAVLANGYHPVPIEPGTKATWLNDWTDYCSAPPPVKLVEAWARNSRGYGVGLACGNIVGIDIDVMDADVSAKIEKAVTDKFGPTLRRIGQAPKVLLLYRADRPFPKIGTKKCSLPNDPPDSKGHGVEVLASGTQFVAFHVHPDTGQPYRWEGGDPTSVPVSDLPTISEEGARWFFETGMRILREHGAVEKGGSIVAGTGGGDRPDKDAGKLQATLEEIESAMPFVPNDDLPRHEWIRIGQALKNAAGDAAMGEFVEWSHKAPKSRKSGTAEAEWERLKVDDKRPAKNRIGIDTIRKIARKHGWLGYTLPATEEFLGALPAETTGTAPKRDRIYYEMAGDMAEDFKSDPLIADLLDCGGTSVLFGDSGSGKTFAALTFGYHVATGTPIDGRFVKKGVVAYFAIENPNSVRKRIAALKRFHRWDGSGLALFPCPINLAGDVDMPLIRAQLADLKAKHGRIELVVIDTYAKATAGGDEDSAKDFGIYFGNVMGIQTVTEGAHTLTIHHPGHGDKTRERGSYRIRTDFDVSMRLADRKVTLAKVKDERVPAPWSMRLEEVELGALKPDGSPVTSCVAIFGDFGPAKDAAGLSPKQTAVERDILDYLDLVAQDPTTGRKVVTLKDIAAVLENGQDSTGAGRQKFKTWLEIRGKSLDVIETQLNTLKAYSFGPRAFSWNSVENDGKSTGLH
jgi:hypothetical protein